MRMLLQKILFILLALQFATCLEFERSAVFDCLDSVKVVDDGITVDSGMDA